MRILVLREKHGDQYLNATTEEEFLDACLMVVKGRFGPDNNWWGLSKPEKPEKPNLGLTSKQIKELPESLIKSAAQKELANYERALVRYNNELADY